MDTLIVNTFSEYVEKVDGFDNEAEIILFRGQAVKGNLLPSVCRDKPSVNTTDVEKLALSELRRMGSSFLPDPKISDWDLMVMAQHFGMKTRLLDWTSNPLAALWFGCSDYRKGDCFVYVLVADEFLSTPQNGPFDNGSTRVIRPNLNNPRIIAQHGWFTAHKFSTKVNKFVAMEKNKDMKRSVVEIKVPEHQRPHMLKSLERYGVSSQTLFPDFEGLCKFLNWKHSNA